MTSNEPLTAARAYNRPMQTPTRMDGRRLHWAILMPVLISVSLLPARAFVRAETVTLSRSGADWWTTIPSDDGYCEYSSKYYASGAHCWGSAWGRRLTAWNFGSGGWAGTIPPTFNDMTVQVYGREDDVGSGPPVILVDWSASSIQGPFWDREAHFVYSSGLFSCSGSEVLNSSAKISHSTAISKYVYNRSRHDSAFADELSFPNGLVFVLLNPAITDDYHVKDVALVFTVPCSKPSRASSPSPSNSATNVSTSADLGWGSISGAQYIVYFGTDSSPDDGEWKTNTYSNNWSPSSTLEKDTTYYWRIDTRNDCGTTTGSIWSFTTVPFPDFRIESISLNPSSPTANSTFSATVKVKNYGTGSGDAKYLDVWANRSSSAGCESTGDDYANMGNINQGVTKTYTFSGLLAGSAGTKTFRAFIDSGCDTDESNENNNQSTKAYTVQSTPKVLTGLSISGSSSISKDGSAQYTATASWSDGTTSSATSSASWEESSSYCHFTGNKLYNDNNSGSSKTVTITVSYSSGGVTKTSNKTITLEDKEGITVVLTGLSISGSSSIPKQA